MEITPRELRDVEIREAFRGYSRDEVNELLERAAATLESVNERVQQMTERLSTAQSETGHTRETEDILHRTLLLAQRAADEAVNEASAKARQMVDDAEIQSRRMIADAEADARRRGESERRRLEEEILDFASRRDALLADVEALTRFEADYRERMVRALEADLTALRSRPAASPGAAPQPSDVEIPAAADAFTRREYEPPAASTPTPAFSTPAPSSDPFAPSPPSYATTPSTPAPPTTTPSYTPASVPSSADPARGPEASTQAVDVQALFERSGVSTPVSTLAFEQPAVTPAPPVATPAPPVENAEAEVLDDDAFFATLREAVHDDTPLGPRDEDATGEHSFFEDESDNAGFRDVFRRRR